MKRLLLTLFLLAAPVAFGATPLEALRAGASAARAQVSQTRTQQLQGQAELNKLAARIEELKAQAKGKLLPGGELDSALKKSQALSASLTSSAAALSAQEAALETANLALLTELSNELTRLRADFDRASDRTARGELIGKLRALRAERDQVRAALPAAKLPVLEAVKPSDDPEDLLEQADLLKDNEDKVRKQLQTVEKRIAEARQERDLDNRVRQFLGDEALFDEGDRRLRVTRSETVRNDTANPAPAAGGFESQQPQAQAPARFSAGEANTGTGVGGFASPAATADNTKDSSAPTGSQVGIQPPPPGFGARTPTDPANTSGGSQTRTVSGADARPAPGGRIAGNDEDDDLEDLEIQRAKLKGLAEELKARASQLQKKAAQLK